MINTISFIFNSRIGKSKYLTIDELISNAFDESFIPPVNTLARRISAQPSRKAPINVNK